MKLYVANTSPQDQVIYYRLGLDEEGEVRQEARYTTPREQRVPRGAQAQLGGDMHQSQVKEIVDQLRKFNLVSEDDVQHGRCSGAVPYVYAEGQPVRLTTIHKAIQHNRDHRLAEGAERRKAAALAAGLGLQKSLGVDGAELDVEIEQVGGDPEAGPSVDEGFRVSTLAPRDAAERKAQRASNRKGRSRNA